MADGTRLPTSRAARTAVLGRLAAGQAARHAGARLSTVGATDERKRRVMDHRQAEAMRAFVDALGLMRGAAMKVGQMLSMVDIGLIPEELREDFQRSLAALRDSAPTVGFKDMRKVIESDLGGRVEDLFVTFDKMPIGAASIGQVYRATLEDGREVAVKVQYPGVDKAVRADLKNLGMVMRAAKKLAPGLDMSSLTAEIRERIEEELDYTLEAQNQRMAGRLYSNHPFIVIPGVVTSLCGPHVLVTEFYEGRHFEDLVEASQEDRDRAGEIIYRFFGGSLYRHRQFSPDPHPGNFIFGDDGKVAFLDFGLYRHVDAEAADTQSAVLRAIFENDEAELHHLLCTRGFISDGTRVSPELAMSYVREVFWWMATNEPLTMDRDHATEAMAQTVNPTSEYFPIARHQQLPPEFVFILRMIVMVMAALGQLGATANWNQIAGEWLYDAAPATALGEADASYRNGEMLAETAI